MSLRRFWQKLRPPPQHDGIRPSDAATEQAHMLLKSAGGYSEFDSDSVDESEELDILDQDFGIYDEEARRRRGSPRWIAIALLFIILLASATVLLSIRRKSQARTRQGPFKGAFADIPRTSQLNDRYKRVSLVAMWSGNGTKPYLRHFFRTAQLNADTIDILFINRKIEATDECLDLPKLGIDATWGGNIKVVCMDNKEWIRRHVEVLCSSEHGWNCTEEQYKDVSIEFSKSRDVKNFFWRSMTGHAYRDLFLHPKLPIWGWVDVDTFLGRFDRFPLNFMSKLSIMSVHEFTPGELLLIGQLTLFDFENNKLSGAWKKLKTLSSADAYTKHIFGQHRDMAEEREWSYRYLGLGNDSAGADLDYMILPHSLGDDSTLSADGSKVYAMSGRDIVYIDASLSREEIEQVVLAARSAISDDFGNLGWSTAHDGSEFMLKDASLTQGSALRLTCGSSDCKDANATHDSLETVEARTGQACDQGWWIQKEWRVCADTFKEEQNQDIMSYVIHLARQPLGKLFRRNVRLDPKRKYDNKLIKHFHWSKTWDWFEFPQIDIDETRVFVMGGREAYTFQMGRHRDKNLTHCAMKASSST